MDGVGEVVGRHEDARSVRVEFEVPPELARYIARKGSVCVDGVSLTVNGVAGRRFDVNLVPHTLEQTILGGYRPGRGSTSRSTSSPATSSGWWPRAADGSAQARGRPATLRALAASQWRCDSAKYILYKSISYQAYRMGSLNTIDEILEDLRQGRMVVIMDDEDRENEGDLLMAASKVRPEDVNFMARYGRGLICLTLTRDRCRQLRLPLMVSDTDVDHGTNFTVSIEAAEGVTTGISAYDRAHTIRTAVAPGRAAGAPAPARPHLPADGPAGRRADPRRPHRGGLRPRAPRRPRAGRRDRRDPERGRHDGAPSRSSRRFAREHGLKIGTIADLIRYRLEKERSVERIAERDVRDRLRPLPPVLLRGPRQRHRAPGAGARATSTRPSRRWCACT